MQGVRRLSQMQKVILDQTWTHIEPLMRSAGDQFNQVLRWSNLYINNKFKVDFPNKNQWLNFSKSITHQIFPNNNILSTGFVLNPANSQKNQVWHNDYQQNVNTIFIPLVDQICQNSTQFINHPIKIPAKISQLGYQSHYGHDILQIVDRQGLQFLTISQIICRSHSIIKMQGGTIHRGISNRSNKQRILFYIMCSKIKKQLNEQQFVQSNMIQKHK